MKRRVEFLEAMLSLASHPTPQLLAVFVFGLLAVTIFSNWLYDLLVGAITFISFATLKSLGTVMICLVLAAVTWRWHLSTIQVATLVKEQSTIQPHPGLIWILSPGPLDTPLFAIRHHLPRLERMWIIVTAGDEAVADTLEDLRRQVAEEGWAFVIEPVEIPEPDFRATHAVVRSIYKERVSAARLTPDETVADITGGYKPMTAGMALACAVNGWPMEYLASDRHPDGRVKSGTQHLVRVDVDFKPESRNGEK